MILYKKLCSHESLEQAWFKVRANALKSDSPQVRGEAQQFSLQASKKLRSIQSKLSHKKFEFTPARGVIIINPKSGKKRPVVVAPIESRIVQRALLQIIQSIPEINSELTAGFNFGGVPGEGFGVPGAIAKAVILARQGGYFIRTDIKSFFTAVPRTTVVDDICRVFSTEIDLVNTFRASVVTEIADAARHGDDLELFPIYESGVAQGSSISPLLCNYLLRDFDAAMNSRGITCIRYIDDIIIFGKDRNSTKKAFDAALRRLHNLGLNAYDPFISTDAAKAEHGQAKEGFEFLGCHIRPDRVRPTDNKRNSLLARVKEIFFNCLKATTRSSDAIFSKDQELTYSGAIALASTTIRAWGNTYSFCSDDRLMNSIDMQIDEIFIEFRRKFTEKIARLSNVDRRKAIGLFSLADCKRDSNPNSARLLALE